MWFDLALTYDREARACDLKIGADGDLVLDETPITPMLLSVGLDRRAAPDDELPGGRDVFLAPASFSERRGAIGDALDPAGDVGGSRCWLLDRAQQTEETRLLYRFWLVEAMSWAEGATGAPAEIETEWVRPGMLGYRVRVDGTTLSGGARG